MPDQPDHSVRELGSTRLKLRGDLNFTPQTSGGQAYFMVEDPLNSRFFRLGHAEYTFVSLLDGGTTISDALSHLSTVMPNHRMTEVDAAGLCRWLVEMDLAHTAESSQAERLAGNAKLAAQKKSLARWNPLVFRLPLGRPDSVFASLVKPIGWLYSRWSVICWLALIVIGSYEVFSDWDRFAASSQGIFAPSNWIWLVTCWVILKIVHETSHGVVCKRYGGTVRETGILFILLAPLAYVDVTSSWRFRSRRQRIYVAAAGMYVELLVAAIAAVTWANTDSGWLNNFCFNVIVMASFTTLLFNANPLMKFDGYYILSDALGMPNLYVNGQSYTRYWGRRYLLGLPTTLPDWPHRHRAFIGVYGWAALCWRMFICVSLTITAATLFHGAGIVLAFLAALLWLGLPALRFVHFMINGKPGEQPHRRRFLLTAGSAAAICVIVFGFVPWPGGREAPAIVEYSPHTVVRASSAGFVSEIHVESGQQVRPGQLLVLLDNRELVRDLADLELQISQSQLRGRQHEQKSELAAKQAEAKKCEGLRIQLREKRAQVEQLAVRAPCDGKIVRRNLDVLLGMYLDEGDEIVTLGDEPHKELRVSISQDDLEVFAQRVGKAVGIDVSGQPLWRSDVEKLIPRASLSLTHPAMASANGGRLPVKPISRRADDSREASYELLAPRFDAIVRLSEADCGKLRAGQRAIVTYHPFSESIGRHIYEVSSRWIRERFSQ